MPGFRGGPDAQTKSAAAKKAHPKKMCTTTRLLRLNQVSSQQTLIQLSEGATSSVSGIKTILLTAGMEGDKMCGHSCHGLRF